MSHPAPEQWPERQSEPDQVVKFWLPPGLTNSLRDLTGGINISVLVFMRKSIRLHQLHRSDEQPAETEYPDQDQLKEAFDTLQNNEGLKLMFGVELAGYLRQLDTASLAIMDKQAPQDHDFTVAPVILPSDMAAYVDSRISPQSLPDYYLSAHAFGIAATLELMWLYSIIEPAPGKTDEQP